MSMLETLKNITERSNDERRASVIDGVSFVLKENCANDFHKDQLPEIPAGSTIVGDFAGDFGMYGVTEVDGVLHRIKIELRELHKVDFGRFDARN